MLLAQLWVLLAAFKKSVVWGLLVLFIPFVSLAYIVLFFTDMKFPVLMYLIGIVLVGGGAAMASRSAHHRLSLRQAEEAATAR